MNWGGLRKVLTLILGGGFLLAGLAMLVLPGPALVFIPLGVAILAAEFGWARRLRRRIVSLAHDLDATPPENDQRKRRQ